MPTRNERNPREEHAPARTLTPAEKDARREKGKRGTPYPLSPSTQSKIDVVPLYRHQALLKLHSKALNLRRPRKTYDRARVAPFTELQELARRQAKKIITDQERNNLHGKAQTQLENANQQNILNTVQPYLNQEVNPLTARAQYLNPYQNNMIQTLREESQQHLLEDILPRVNASYIRGFHSSGRNKLTQKAIADSQKTLQREISKLLSHGHEKASELGLEHARIKAQETQGRGTLASQAASRQKESDIIGAREMQNLSQIQQSQQHENARSLNQLGSEEQRQEQAKLNIPYQEYLEEREAPYLHLARQAGIVNNLPQPGFQTLSTTPPVVDIPPNLYAAGAGGLGVFADLMHPKRARGGRVTKRAAGGSVHMPAPDTSQMQNIAQQFQTPARDPRWGYLGALGGTMLSNLHVNPLRAFGAGTLAGRESMNEEYKEEDQRSVHAANLMDKINSTRQSQQELLQRYEIAKEGNALTRRGQDLQAVHHREALENQAHKLEALSNKPQKLEREDQRALTDMRKQMSVSIKAKRLLAKLEDLGKNIDTGPNAASWYNSEKIPYAKNAAAATMGAPLAKVALYNKLMNQYVTMLDQHSKGVAFGRLKQIQAGNPSLELPKETLMEIYKYSNEELDLGAQEAKFVTNFVKSGKGNAAEAESAFLEMLESKQQPYLGAEGMGDSLTPMDTKRVTPINNPYLGIPSSERQQRIAQLRAKATQ